jgi:hypothetical protein
MPEYSFAHVADPELKQDLRAGAVDDRAGLAKRLAQIAEFDCRRLYLPEYPSMYQFCMRELKYSEDAACRRIAAAKLARRYPALFVAIADGRHSLSTTLMLEPYLLPETAGELIESSSDKSKSELAHFLAGRFPRPDLPTIVQPVFVPAPTPEPASALVVASESASPELPAPARVGPIDRPISTPAVVPPSPRPRVAPLSPERYAIQVTVSKATHDKLRQAQALLSHVLPAGDVAEVLDRALDVLILQLEKRKFGATTRPGRPRDSKAPRHIPAHVRRAVRARDGDRCTFKDDQGRRCNERKFLEFDHIDPVARGGQATISGLRLRCRAHNQYEAERVYGREFMRQKRQAAAEARSQSASVRPRVSTTNGTSSRPTSGTAPTQNSTCSSVSSAAAPRLARLPTRIGPIAATRRPAL